MIKPISILFFSLSFILSLPVLAVKNESSSQTLKSQVKTKKQAKTKNQAKIKKVKNSKLAQKTPPITSAGNISVKAMNVQAPQPASPANSSPFAIETIAPQVLLMDHHTGQVLLEKNADAPMYPSSMTKIMTSLVVFDRLAANNLHLNTLMLVSEKAWRTEGTRMFLDLNSQVSIEDLLRGIIIQSGNDACVTIAEGLCGSEEVFVHEMNKRAQEIGALHTNFKNASGLPDSDHLTTARDLMIISRYLINTYPQFYAYFNEKEFFYNNIKQSNRNPLLGKISGCDGIKTGYTEGGRYGLVASVQENEMRLNLVINGLPSEKVRFQESLKLMTWAIKTFMTQRLYRQGDVIDTAVVWLGKEETVPLTIAQDCILTFPRINQKDIKIEIKYEGPLSAPLAQNTPVGKLFISGPFLTTPLEIPLLTAKAVEKVGFFKRISSSLYYLIWGKS